MPEQQVRILRIFQSAVTGWSVQYGFWQTVGNGINQHFRVLRSWPMDSERQAQVLRKRLELEILINPELTLPPDAKPVPHLTHRAVQQIPEDSRLLLQRAVAGLTDPLPSIEQSHRRLLTIAPERKREGRQFGTYLADPVYQLLIAMAAAAEVNRNRIIEALILVAGSWEFTNGEAEQSSSSDSQR